MANDGKIKKVDTPEKDENQFVELAPFEHQVGGHNSMFLFDSLTVCKPLIDREQYFYKTMPAAFREFTPEYRGVANVSVVEDSDGFCSLLAESSPTGTGSSDSSGADEMEEACAPQENAIKSTVRRRFRMRSSANIKMTSPRHNLEERFINPWSVHCQRKLISKLQPNQYTQFLLLENLASQFEHPCILDLKMGTRQHGDDASEQKRLWMIRKCQKTTSAALGIRVCGMQVYKVELGHYIYQDKYFGRELSPEQVPNVLRQFLHNGHEIRANILDPVISRLQQLESLLTQYQTYRFYSSSLLIMYEAIPSHEPHIDVRMIDFAHTTHEGCLQDTHVHSGPDRGYLFGLENLVRMFTDVKKSLMADNTLKS